MRSKHPESGANLYTAGSDDPILSLGTSELRKSKSEAAKLIAAAGGKAKSRCATARESSRSGGTTPRCASQSPSPKCETILPAKEMEKCEKSYPAKEMESETPRTYLIKGSFLEPEITSSKNLEQVLGVNSSAGKNSSSSSDRPSPKNMITCASPIASKNKFISDIEEVEWFLDEDRGLDGGGGGDGGGALSLDRGGEFVETGRREDEMEEQGRREDGVLSKIEERELRRKKGKAPEENGERRGKAPMAFPTVEEEELLLPPRMMFSSGTRCQLDSSTMNQAEVMEQSFSPEMPAWLDSAYKSLARLRRGGANSSYYVPIIAGGAGEDHHAGFFLVFQQHQGTDRELREQAAAGSGHRKLQLQLHHSVGVFFFSGSSRSSIGGRES